MQVILKALIALVVGAVGYAVARFVCIHFGIDIFWAMLIGVIVGLVYFFSGPEISGSRPL